MTTYKHITKPELLEISQDEYPESPREWSNLGIMICSHPHYQLGDKQISSETEANEILKNAVVALPLYLLDHSGLRMKIGSFNDPWDSGQVGFIYTTREKIKECFGDKAKPRHSTLIKSLTSEVEVYDDYLSGNVNAYAHYSIQTCNLGYEHRELIDSCGGYFGDYERNGKLFDIFNIDEWSLVEN